MTVFVGSRYANQPIVVVTLADGSQAPAIYGPAPLSFNSLSYYQVQFRDRFDTLAAKFLGNPLDWWSLAECNPQVFYPENLQQGAMLRIPTS